MVRLIHPIWPTASWPRPRWTQLGLDVLHILPTGQAWHKARALCAAEHRLAMCELAFGDLPKVHIDAA